MSEDATVRSIDCYVVEVPRPYRYSGESDDVEFLPGTDYFFEPDWDQVYSLNLESLLVKVTTTDGTCGWGEVQAPIVPEVAGTLLSELLGPMVLGESVLRAERLRDRLYRSMNVRGHTQGFMIDAISGLDIALWDAAGKHLDASVGTLLGGRERERLDAYVSLPGFEPEELADQAAEFVDAGFGAVKLFAGRGVDADVAAVEAVRDRIGSSPEVFVDAFWGYDVRGAVRLAEELREHDAGFLEAPLAPEDRSGHARLVDRSPIPTAVGEPLRTASEFRQWLEATALDVAQPDVVRAGLSEGRRIADLAASFHTPVAPHFGAGLGVGMAATWHLASAIPGFRIQEHQPTCFEVANRYVESELRHDDGALIVPNGPGLGVRVDESALEDVVTATYRARADGSEGAVPVDEE